MAAQDIPERLRLTGRGRRGARRPRRSTPPKIGKAIGAKLGLAGPVLIGEGAFGDIYVDRALKPADRAPRAGGRASPPTAPHPQVEAVFTNEQLRAHAVADRDARQMDA